MFSHVLFFVVFLPHTPRPCRVLLLSQYHGSKTYEKSKSKRWKEGGCCIFRCDRSRQCLTYCAGQRCLFAGSVRHHVWTRTSEFPRIFLVLPFFGAVLRVYSWVCETSLGVCMMRTGGVSRVGTGWRMLDVFYFFLCCGERQSLSIWKCLRCQG